MKKLFLVCTLFVLSVTLVNCSADSNETSTLFVDGTPFKIGVNSTQRFYNSIVYSDDHRIVFSIVEKTEAGVDPNVIELDFYYTGGVINGTYPIYSTGFMGVFPDNYVQGDYNSPSIYFGDAEVAGTITITDLGNKKFKLQFNNAVFTANDNSGMTRTITGFCQPTFW